MRRKRRRAPVRRVSARRTSFKRSAPRRRSKKIGMKGEMGLAISAGIYGALRSRVSSMIAPYTTWIPGGSVADELGMIVAMYGIKKVAGNKVPMLNDVLKAGKAIEYARIGETIAQGGLNAGFLSGNKSNGALIGTVFV